MDIKSLSTRYQVRRITDADIPCVLSLCRGNPLYFQHCPPLASNENIKVEMMALPPNKTYEDKYYIGFYENNRLAAVMDLITKYPNDGTAFIGFFMVEQALQGASVGTNIICESLTYLRSIGYKKARLGYVKGNTQPERFWRKNGFIPTGEEVAQERYTVVVMERLL